MLKCFRVLLGLFGLVIYLVRDVVVLVSVVLGFGVVVGVGLGVGVGFGVS